MKTIDNSITINFNPFSSSHLLNLKSRTLNGLRLIPSFFTAQHTLKLRPGGSNSRNDPGVLLVYLDSTHRAENAHIFETSQRVANSGVRAL